MGGNIEETYSLGSDYATQHAPYQIKMDGTGDYFIIKVDGAIKSVSVGVKMIGGATTSTLDVQGSSDGDSYSSVEKLTISGGQNAILELQTTKQFDPSYRYLKFYFTKGSNIGVGPISITYTVGSESGSETPEEPETPVEPDPTPDPDVESVTVTLNPGDSNAGTWVNSQKTSEASVGNVTFTALGTGGNDSKYYDSDKTWRFYTANSSGVKVSVPTGSSITKVVITVTKGSPSTPSGCTVSSANKVYTYTVSNSPTELSFFKSGSDNLQINKIEVTYTN